MSLVHFPYSKTFRSMLAPEQTSSLLWLPSEACIATSKAVSSSPKQCITTLEDFFLQLYVFPTNCAPDATADPARPNPQDFTAILIGGSLSFWSLSRRLDKPVQFLGIGLLLKQVLQFILHEIYGLCSGDKRSYELAEGFHQYVIQVCSSPTC